MDTRSIPDEMSFDRCDLSIAEFCFSVMDAVQALVAYVDRACTYRYVNKAYSRLFNKPLHGCLGAHVSEVVGDAVFDGEVGAELLRCIRNGEQCSFEGWASFPRVGEYYMDIRYFPHIVEGKVLGAAIIAHDMTDKKAMIREMVIQNRELQRNLGKLEETNAQLRQLLENVTADRERTESNAFYRVSESIAPYLQALKCQEPSEQTAKLADNIETAILNYKPRLDRKLYRLNPALSARERRVAHLIVEGKTSQEIADIVEKSVKTVEYYRSSLRKKLGLCGRRVSLRTFLVS
ncbi:helix-turn-helix transcriptional regulator [Pseudodesulfovibrio senegalensis]|jgi:DNA-binding CsgD family transcriptional regulator|nr:helix-turn-helix transcriptional regulator [Pseudodesulfovibrio senegalensis]